MKVTKEKLPKSLLALDIELDHEQVEKGLDRAARQLSQKYNIPGFRKGKAPRFIVENYFGRDALLEQATEDLINKSFKVALDQEGVNPIGQASIDNVNTEAPFHYRVLVPVAPTVTIPDYRAIQAPFEIEPITDETVQAALDSLRDKHVVLRELEEPRPAKEGDQLAVKLESFVDDEPLEERDENGELRSTTLVLEPKKVVDGLLEALIGAEIGTTVEATAHMPEDHASDKVRDKDVAFKVLVEGIQERIPADWNELPVLENFDGTFEELQEKTRKDLEESAKTLAERKTIDAYVEQLVAGTDFDIPHVMIHERAHELLHEQGAQFERYGISLDQMLQYRGKSHEEATEELEPEAEQQLKTTLALQEVVRSEGLTVDEAEINAEIVRMVAEYGEEERERAQLALSTQLRANVASMALDRKLRDRLVALAQGQAPALEAGATTEEPAAEASTPELTASEEAPTAAEESTPELTASEEAPTVAEEPAAAEASTPELTASEEAPTVAEETV